MRAILDKSIYEDAVSLERAYYYFPQYTVNWKDVKNDFVDDSSMKLGTPEIKAADQSNLCQFQIVCAKSIMKFDHWQAFYDVIGFFPHAYIGIFRLLVADHDIDPNPGLVCASYVGCKEILLKLLQHHAIDISYRKSVAARIAVRFGHTEIIDILEHFMENPNYLLIRAVIAGNASLVKRILSYRRIDPRTDSNKPIRLAVFHGHFEIVKLLLDEPRTHSTTESFHSFRLAASLGHTKILLLLLNHHKVPKKSAFIKDNVVLMIAIQFGHTETVKELLQHPLIKPSAFENYALILACRFGQVEIVKLLLGDSKVIISGNHNLALAEACFYGHETIVEMLLNNFNFDHPKTAYPAIMGAVRNGNLKVIEVILHDGRMDPSFLNDRAAMTALDLNYYSIFRRLMMDERVDKSKRLQNYYVDDRLVDSLPNSFVNLVPNMELLDGWSYNFGASINRYDLNPVLFRLPQITHEKIISYLSLSSVYNLGKASALLHHSLGMACDLFPKVHDLSIYNDADMLEYAYRTQKHHIINWSSIRKQFKFFDIGEEFSAEVREESLSFNCKLFSKTFPEKILKVESWMEYNEVSSYLKIPSMKGLFKLLFNRRNLNANDSLYSAVLSDEIELVRLAQTHPDIDYLYNNSAALSIAAYIGSYEIVKLLIDSGCDPSAGSNQPICNAVSRGNVKIYLCLMDTGVVDPSDRDDYCIRTACAKGYFELVELLLTDERVDASGLENDAFVQAAAGGHVDVLKRLLLIESVDPGDRHSDALVRAIENERADVVELLLKVPSIDPTARENMALITASIYEYVDIVELLLVDGRSDPTEPCHEVDLYGEVIGSEYIDNVLTNAISMGNMHLVELYLNDGRANPCVDGYRSICEAIKRCEDSDNEILDWLFFDHRVYFPANDDMILRCAAACGNDKIVELALKHEMVRPGIYDNMAIIDASANGHFEVVSLLIKHKDVDPTARNNLPYRTAFDNGDERTIRVLLSDPRVSYYADYIFRK